MEAHAFIGYLVEYDSMKIYKIWVLSKKKVISTRDVTFKESLFYDLKETDTASELYKEIEDVIEVYQLPSIQQREEEHSDTDSDSDLAWEHEEEFSDAHENNQEQEQQTHNIEELIRGVEPMLPTPQSTPEAENSSSTANPHSREIIEGISQQNIQRQRRIRKPSEKARHRVYHAALDNPEDLQACYTVFKNGKQHQPNRLHRNDLPEPPNT
jgi:hypothetical protein